MKVIIDPEQMAQLGIHEEIGVTLPEGFASYTPAQRKAWAERMIAAELEATAREFAAAMASPRDRGVQP